MQLASVLSRTGLFLCSAMSIWSQSNPQMLFTPGAISTVTTTNHGLNGIALDNHGSLYIADPSTCIVEKLNLATKATVTVAGTDLCATTGSGSGDGGPAVSAQLSDPGDIILDGAGNIYIAQPNSVREVSAATGIITTVAGNGTAGPDSGDGGPATAATLSNPGGLAVDPSGNLYIAEAYDLSANNPGGRVRRVDATSKIITTFAGTGTSGFSGANGPAIDAQLGSAAGIVIDATGRNLYIADPVDFVVWHVNLTTGIISVYAGTGTQSGYAGDGGPAINAQLIGVEALALDSIGDLYLFDGLRIRVVNPAGVIETVAGNGSQTVAPDGSLANATGFSLLFNGPGVLAIDSSGNLFTLNVAYESIPPNIHSVITASQIVEVAQSTTYITFPEAVPGLTKSSQSLLLRNTGSAPLTFSSPISISGSNASDFTQTDTCGSNLASGAYCSVTVTFAPLALGLRKANVVISDNAPGSPQVVPLTGPGSSEVEGIHIDIPGAQSSPYLGVANFFGWSIDNVAPVARVEISVDGAPVGTAFYGTNRVDVCIVYPNQVGCPNVGWSFQLDTTRFASGTHTLGAMLMSSTGAHRTASSPFSVGNWTGNNPTRINVDVPNTSTPYAGVVGFGGWAINPTSPITTITLSVDGAPVAATASYGGSRPDVCTVFQNSPGCPNVGWNASVDTAMLADGAHMLAVTATPASGSSTTVTASFTVANNTPANPTKLSIDLPNSPNQVLSGMTHIAGWAFNQNNPVGVSVYVDGNYALGATYGFARPDVCAIFSSPAGCPNVGWNGLLDTTKLANGSHVLQVFAQASGSQEANATATIPFTVANSTANNPTRIFIDVPVGQSAVVSGTLAAAGWAINDHAAISQVTIYVDGTSYGTAQYGSSRPDVCIVYSGRPGCPDVGWSMNIDTTQLSNGRHMLTASASTANGGAAIVSSPFTVANWTDTGNPVRLSIDIPSSSAATLSGASAALGGWAIDNQALITGVTISVDGVLNGNAAYGGNRPDVCAAFPNQPNCPNVGWNYVINTTLLPDGMHSLDVTALAADGQSYTTSSPFKVANVTSSNPILIGIDVPNAASGNFGNTVAFGGWAIDSNAAIRTVYVYVDGVFAGTAAYGGARNDVCSAFPGRSGCPNVGWNFLLDTTAYSVGAHSLQVTAIATNGQTETMGASFNISNYVL